MKSNLAYIWWKPDSIVMRRDFSPLGLQWKHDRRNSIIPSRPSAVLAIESIPFEESFLWTDSLWQPAKFPFPKPKSIYENFSSADSIFVKPSEVGFNLVLLTKCECVTWNAPNSIEPKGSSAVFGISVTSHMFFGSGNPELAGCVPENNGVCWVRPIIPVNGTS